MLARMDDLPASLRNLEIRLSMAVEAAAQAQDDLNLARQKAGLAPVSSRLVLATEHRGSLDKVIAEAVAAVRAEKRADPPSPKLVWSRGRGEPAEHDFAHPRTAILCALETIRHSGLDADDYPDMIGCLSNLVGHCEPPTTIMLETARYWANGWAKRLQIVRDRAKGGRAPTTVEGTPWRKPAPPTSGPVHHLTAAEIVRAGQIRRGEIIELPTDPTARAIVAGGAKRRGENEDKPL
jgi:hypothetical protein